MEHLKHLYSLLIKKKLTAYSLSVNRFVACCFPSCRRYLAQIKASLIKVLVSKNCFLINRCYPSILGICMNKAHQTTDNYALADCECIDGSICSGDI